MKGHHMLLTAGTAVLVIALSLWSFVIAQSPSDSRPGNAALPSAPEAGSLGSDSNPVGLPEVFVPDQYRPSADELANAVAVPSATVYFTPQDENTSTTVLFLYNTSTASATVRIWTYTLNGSSFISAQVSVPPAGLVRICGDEVSTASVTWQDVVLINFRTASTYAKMTLPAGVKAEGYVVWNNASTYDPLQVAPTLPLRFSTDPPTVFLPSVRTQ